MKCKSDLDKKIEGLRKLTLTANYAEAFKGATELRKKYKDHFDVEYMYAKLLGDYADELPKPARLRLKREASGILRKLCRCLNGKTSDVKFWVRSNYYYQTGRYRELVKVGCELMPSNALRGLYAAGGGSALYAEQVLKRGGKRNRTRALAYARDAVYYWKKYFTLNPREPFYFPHSLQAMGHAILGQNSQMEMCLLRAQALSKLPKDYWEFRGIRELCWKL